MGYSKGYMPCNRLNAEAHMRSCSAPFTYIKKIYAPSPKKVKRHFYKICFGKYNDFPKNVMLTHKSFIVSFLVTDLLDIIHLPYNSPN